MRQQVDIELTVTLDANADLPRHQLTGLGEALQAQLFQINTACDATVQAVAVEIKEEAEIYGTDGN